MGRLSRAKVICGAGRHPSRVSRELITVTEIVCAALPWHNEVEGAEGDAGAKFTYSLKGQRLNDNINEVHHYVYPPPPLNPTSFSTRHTTAEISVSRPSILSSFA